MEFRRKLLDCFVVVFGSAKEKGTNLLESIVDVDVDVVEWSRVVVVVVVVRK